MSMEKTTTIGLQVTTMTNPNKTICPTADTSSLFNNMYNKQSAAKKKKTSDTI